MEDMARLALVEQNVRNPEKFHKILYELLGHINCILDNPHDYRLRIIQTKLLKSALGHEAFVDYLKSIGFQAIGDAYTYPKEQTLSDLRMAQAAIERKIYFCCGSVSHNEVKAKPSYGVQAKRPKLTPSKVLTTKNPFLLKVQHLFNDVIKYENEELQDLARQHIPLVTLQLMALDRLREHQRKLKAGEIKGHDMPFDIALLMELLGWFKHKFFSWVDQPACARCGGATTHRGNTTRRTETEACNVEVYNCASCNVHTEFVRHNDVRALLRTRRGRCGEWANCFALLCRAAGYDTRYVYDTTDHVWCEVFDYDTNTWLHVDPCEGTLNAPLTYSHGWKKQLCYVIALSRDDLQDVTWRYTSDHKQVLKRRTECSEAELVSAILALREDRQRQVSEPRRKYLAKRCLQEIVQLMVEKKPTDYESHGRISGSKEWRTDRGEIGAQYGHTFSFQRPGTYAVRYCAATDRYRVGSGLDREGNGLDGVGSELDREGSEAVAGWAAGAFHCKGVFRKVEADWRMVYLAREEGETYGAISWKLMADGDHRISSLTVRATTALYETGAIDWTVTFDDGEPVTVKVGESPTKLTPSCRSAVVCARLSGGLGDTAWQHAQLFRQRADSHDHGLEIIVDVTHSL